MPVATSWLRSLDTTEISIQPIETFPNQVVPRHTVAALEHGQALVFACVPSSR